MVNSWSRESGQLAAAPPGRDPLFAMVEVEINSRCNRSCSYCPNSVAPRRAPKLMKLEQFQVILDRLAVAQFTGRLSYHFYNEPLLHPKLPLFVRATKETLPAVRQVLYTNGDFLNEKKHAELLQAGVSRFVVTQHDGKPGPGWDRVTWLVPSNLELTNRAGLVSVGPRPATGVPCHAPATMLIVTITGNVVLCYEDSRESRVFGNVFEQSLAHIWWSPEFVAVRARLGRGDRSAVDVCRACNNRAHQTPARFDYVR